MVSDRLLLVNKSNQRAANIDTFDWVYGFQDGTRLMGKVCGYLDPDSNRLLDPENCSAIYQNAQGQVLSRWQAGDFIAFDLTTTGEELLIVASNDNCIGNSLCLVSGINRSCAQVTDEGKSLVREVFQYPAWSLQGDNSSSKPAFSWNCSVSPFFPFVSLRFNLQSTSSKKFYRWTVSPYFPFCPLLEVGESLA
ncbi:MAG: hypothetical protein EWV53_08880 [Microcystis panniformis Mp_MB_F_20051200_S9]|uniref:Uncharacterized protein n=1 Tax=Microcystis panniformis Mp_MB_F_20051200_S9 TaxID=2486223 RepID=A0A552Q232_9CHRO|nr:MAG: hypothetical protein EWV42_22280 [Microcystis panniformis Mp_GB_SS_20050300_S99D]TRV44081.1 MAG: hypothetical protein EWV87_19805 [Microcystis panniformis Mp_GB_SS_20050300_S99]TRV44491.1 MAG: hypothetical protein EWV43_18635 [Microcystis panniformis Mp_MB_F_20080800_S26D]TRV56703.1 MAG: hypothetical protein EWV86_22235 [Microcystis panniformis Mp_MB_F_20051200_S9D]TRV60965.1 MAG: hypothetical protein EWV69_08925 [Microcystis panniformis Mp_MB_F_20080800_S26]TRV63249.1 MAG: hypothetica